MQQELIEMLIKNNREREDKLSEYACKSESAIRLTEDKYDFRSEFFKDVDRVVHSKSYTRYIDKTQVFAFIKNDHITHRVIHVQLVSKIGRTIGRCLNLNEDLIEAIALGHDVGHSPFGHMGERFLNNICVKNNIGYFVHNAQGVRIFNKLENETENGINLSIQTLDGILAHNGEILQDRYEPKWNKTIGMFFEELYNCVYVENYSKNIIPMTLEGCVTRISDILSYVGRDIEDAIKVGVIEREDIPENISKVLGNNNSSIVNTLVMDVIENSINKPYISFSNKIYEALSLLKDFNYKVIYKSKEATKNEHKLEELFNQLFEIYFEYMQSIDYTESINVNGISQTGKGLAHFLMGQSKEYLAITEPKRIIIDYIAGHTDNYFFRECEANIKGFSRKDLYK